MLDQSQSLRSTLLNHSMLREGNLSSLPAKSLLTPRRLDLAVKWRFFLRLLGGGDPNAERVYCWHIEKRSGARMRARVKTDQWKGSISDYVIGAQVLADSMAKLGFLESNAVPIDPNGELLGGAHRLACAMALGIESIPVERHTRMVWAPAWDENWFVANGVNEYDLARIKADWELMKQ